MFVYKKRAARQQKSALAAATGDNDMVLPYAFSDNPTGGNLKLEKENKLMMMAAKSSTHPPSIDNSDNSAPPALAPIVNQYAFEPTRESIDYIRYASVYTQNPVVADNALVASSGTVTQHKWTAPSTPSSKNASMIEDSSAGQEHRDSMMSEFEVSPKAASSEMASKRDKYRSIYSNYSVEGSNGGDQQQLDHAPPNSSSRHQSTVSMSTRKFISPLARSAWTSSEEEENNNSKHFSVGGDGEVNVRYSNVTKRDSWMTEGSVSSSPTIQLKKMTKSFFIYN